MIIGVFSYQGTMALFVCLSLISIINHSKNVKLYFKNNIFMFFIYFIPIIINYIFILMFSRNRVGGIYNFQRTISTIIDSTKYIVNGFGLFPKGSMIIILLASIIISFIHILKNNKFKLLLKYVYAIIIIIYLFIIAPIIPQTSERIAVYPRTCYAFFSIIGVSFILINRYCNNRILIFLLIATLSLEFVSFNNIIINRYVVNSRDKDIILQLEKKVEDYEINNNVQVDKIVLYNLDSCKKFYKDINDNINVSALKESPSVIGLYTYYTNRHLIEIKPNENVYNDYFLNKNYDDFSLEQVVIIDDTIHLYLY